MGGERVREPGAGNGERSESLPRLIGERYRIERQLGQGGMATVYLAEDLRHERHVAIKVLKPDLAAVIGADRFIREIKTLAVLQHPHILGLIDSGEVDGTAYYVMPFVEGESLRDRLDREKQLPIADALRIAREVASALDYAHRHGVIHRDIKPENILLHDGQALVADFGIALAVSSAGGARMTDTGITLGTPSYMSPEQAMGEREITARSDVYALGVVTYEMLLGEAPFTGPTAQAVVAKAMSEAPRRPTTMRRSIPPHVEDAVLTALEKLPADRYVSAAAFAEHLTGSEAVEHRARRPVARTLRLPLVGGGAFLAGAALAWLVLAGRGEAGSVRFGAGTRLSWQPGLELQPAISPDGKLVAYGGGTATSTRIFVRQISGGRVVPLTGDSTISQSAPAWSPDGTRILYLAGGAVFSAPSAGGPPRQEVRVRPGNPITSADWARDGTTIAFAAGDSLFVQAAGDTARFVARVRSANNCRWSPDASSIACASGNALYAAVGPMFGNLAASAIVEVPARGGPLRYLTDRTALNQTPVWSPDGSVVYFVSNRHGPLDIYAIQAGRTGGIPVRLTTGLGAHSISLAADGRRLAYSILRDVGNIWAIRLADLPRGMAAAEPVTHGTQPIDAFSVSPDGRWVLYSADLAGNGDLYRAPAAGGEVERLTTDPSGDFSPDMSPGPREEIAFQSWRRGTRDLFVMPLDGGALELAASSAREEAMPQWAPDGRALTFMYFDAVGGIGIVRRESDGSWAPAVTRHATGQWPSWSPDGGEIVFTSGLATGSLLTMSADSGAPEMVMDATAPGMPRAEQPFYSPDGRSILFTSHDARGTGSIWSIPVTGGTPRRLIEFSDPERPVYRPYWALGPDRLYVIVQEQQSETWVMEVVAGR
ncbi:MAG TPA: protein kinase [Gemmatimonadales bacterium]|nr:protein kinase [Gemmatimonadales bacterium]